MHSALIFFNPLAGMRWRSQRSALDSLVSALSRDGVKTSTVITRGDAASSGTLLQGLHGFDTVIACGGDGTVNEVLQSLMADPRDLALGIVPFGSGNLLANYLGNPRAPRAAARTLVHTGPQPSSVGVIEQLQPPHTRRYWLAAAGVGADARVICDLPTPAKQHFGIAAYYVESTRQLLFSRRPLPRFTVAFDDLSTGQRRCQTATQLVAERIAYFGHFLETRDAAPLDADELRVVLFHTSRRATYLHYGIRLLAHRATGRHASFPGIEVLRTRELTCSPLPEAAVPTLAEVDGELIGEVPVRISIAPRRIRLIRPAPLTPR